MFLQNLLLPFCLTKKACEVSRVAKLLSCPQASFSASNWSKEVSSILCVCICALANYCAMYLIHSYITYIPHTPHIQQIIHIIHITWIIHIIHITWILYTPYILHIVYMQWVYVHHKSYPHTHTSYTSYKFSTPHISNTYYTHHINSIHPHICHTSCKPHEL